MAQPGGVRASAFVDAGEGLEQGREVPRTDPAPAKPLAQNGCVASLIQRREWRAANQRTSNSARSAFARAANSSRVNIEVVDQRVDEPSQILSLGQRHWLQLTWVCARVAKHPNVGRPIRQGLIQVAVCRHLSQLTGQGRLGLRAFGATIRYDLAQGASEHHGRGTWAANRKAASGLCDGLCNVSGHIRVPWPHPRRWPPVNAPPLNNARSSTFALPPPPDVLLLDDDHVLAAALTLENAELLVVQALHTAVGPLRVRARSVERDRGGAPWREVALTSATRARTVWKRRVGQFMFGLLRHAIIHAETVPRALPSRAIIAHDASHAGDMTLRGMLHVTIAGSSACTLRVTIDRWSAVDLPWPSWSSRTTTFGTCHCPT
jgi:hypothetical protein